MQLRRESTLEEIFGYVSKESQAVILFIDQSALCTTYTAQPWLRSEGIEIVEVDQEIVDILQIGKVPQFRFYVDGTEVHDLIGTATEETYRKRKDELFNAPFTWNKKTLTNFKNTSVACPEVEL